VKIKRPRLKLTRRRDIKGYLFVLPFIIGFILFFAQPMVRSFTYAVGKLSVDPVRGVVVTPVGMRNFQIVFDNTMYQSDVLFAFQDMLIDLVVIMIFSVFAALLLNKTFKGRAFARAVFFLPVLIASGILIPGMITETTGGVQALINKSVSPEMFVSEAMKLLKQYNIDNIPVVDSNKKPVGILDQGDL